MADKGYIDTQLNALPQEERVPLKNAFYSVMDAWKLGTASKALNAQWYRYQSTTASVANTEFSFAHGLPSAPTQLIPILDLSKVNSQMPTLAVTRAADASRVYLSSPSTSAVFTCFLEA